ncbi:MAG TPA: hypothetical protein VG476_12045 [Acidimicrobiales bacterium]|nr:hypothetical protein [Acidimicrobiales bacterium]
MGDERNTGTRSFDVWDADVGTPQLTDAELTALALAGDPDEPLDPDAVPMSVSPYQTPGALPEWYMPPVTARRAKRWRAAVVLVLVTAFLVIEAVGLCSTYGQLVVG